MKRRNFIQTSALASTALMIPQFLRGLSKPVIPGEGKTLIVIQLSGGNDGLNTVVPFRNDIYYAARPKLAIEKQKVLRLSDEQGLHPAMTGLQRLFNDGKATILNSVGYPNPDRSHFRSMDIWHSASDSNQSVTTGWLGRYMDAACKKGASLNHIIEVNESLGLATKGAHHNGLALTNPNQLFQAVNDPFMKRINNKEDDKTGNLAFLYKTLAETTSTAEYIYRQSKIYESKENYPDSQFGKNLKTIAELIISGCHTRVYYISLGGFDTHNRQADAHEKLLKQFSDGMFALMNDLKNNKRQKEVLVMAFSEFGRRVKENASQGTDHGTANNLFLFGGALKQPGIFNPPPNLTHLDQGDLKFQIDFRRVYSAILNNWLDADDTTILGRQFEKLTVV